MSPSFTLRADFTLSGSLNVSGSPGLVSFTMKLSPSMINVSLTSIPRVSIASAGTRISYDSFSIAVSTVYGPLTEIVLSLSSLKIIKFLEFGSIEITPFSNVATPRNVDSIKIKRISEIIRGK